MSICSCLYPLHIIDKRDVRDGLDKDPIEYLAIPQEVIDELGLNDNDNGNGNGNGYRKIKIPKIKMVRDFGLDGVKRDYVKVIWADSGMAMTKRYDVNDHVVVVGCDIPEACRVGKSEHGKSKSGHKCKIKCEEKEVYEVLHPLEEWHSHHIVEI